MTALFAFNFFGIGPMELMILVLILVLLFGIRRLPEVGRYLGKGIIEFKKGIKGLEDDVGDTYNTNTSAPQALPPEAPRPPQRITASAPKFDEPANPSAPPTI